MADTDKQLITRDELLMKVNDLTNIVGQIKSILNGKIQSNTDSINSVSDELELTTLLANDLCESYNGIFKNASLMTLRDLLLNSISVTNSENIDVFMYGNLTLSGDWIVKNFFEKYGIDELIGTGDFQYCFATAPISIQFGKTNSDIDMGDWYIISTKLTFPALYNTTDHECIRKLHETFDMSTFELVIEIKYETVSGKPNKQASLKDCGVRVYCADYIINEYVSLMSNMSVSDINITNCIMRKVQSTKNILPS
ncbi:MAG: hypothetical protein K1V84_03540 [Muribaculaceae bacterium]